MRIGVFLAEHDSDKTAVPNGGNSIVLFNSNLFHGAATIEFASGYEFHRINVNMLFGHRYV